MSAIAKSIYTALQKLSNDWWAPEPEWLQDDWWDKALEPEDRAAMLSWWGKVLNPEEREAGLKSDAAKIFIKHHKKDTDS